MDENGFRKDFVFAWKIENYVGVHVQSMKSAIFTAESLGGTRWCLELYRSFLSDDVECALHRIPDSTHIKEVIVDYTVEVFDVEGQTLKSLIYLDRFFKKGDTKEFRPIIKYKALEEAVQKCSKDKFQIRCGIRKKKPSCWDISASNSEYNMCTAETKLVFHRSSFTKDIDLMNRAISGESDAVWRHSAKLTLEEFEFEVNFTAPNDEVLIEIQSKGNHSSLTCEIFLLDVDGEPRKSKLESRFLSLSKINWKFPSFFRITELKKDDDTYLKDGKFTLRFEFSFHTKHSGPITYSSIPKFENFIDSMDIFKKDMGNMFASSKCTDVVLRTCDKELQAHKSVLMARSPVFNAMFEQDMLESQTGQVDCSDFEFQTISSLLEFLYTGSVPHTDCYSCLRLMVAADKYQVRSLVEECAHYLVSIMSVENAFDILEAAEILNHKKLKDLVSDYIQVYTIQHRTDFKNGNE